MQVLAALRRKATAHLILNQPKRAYATAEQAIRLRFDWPYGHLVKADALLALGQYAAASATYSLAEQLMPRIDPTDDFGRSEVADHMRALTDALAAKSCLTLTLAHECEVTAVAAWPPAAPARRRADRRRSSAAVSAKGLQESVTSAVNDALDAIHRNGSMSHVQLHAPQPAAAAAVPQSPPWFTGSGGAAAAAAAAGGGGGATPPRLDAADGNTLDQLLANEIRRERAAAAAAAAAASCAGATPPVRTDSGRSAAAAAARAPREFFTTLDTSASSNIDCNGALRTTTSELDLKTHTSTLHATMTPVQTTPADHPDSGALPSAAASGATSGATISAAIPLAAAAAAPSAAGTPTAMPSAAPTTPPQPAAQHAQQQAQLRGGGGAHLSINTSMLSSEAVSSGSLPWSSLTPTEAYASAAPAQFMVTGALTLVCDFEHSNSSVAHTPLSSGGDGYSSYCS